MTIFRAPLIGAFTLSLLIFGLADAQANPPSGSKSQPQGKSHHGGGGGGGGGWVTVMPRVGSYRGNCDAWHQAAVAEANRGHAAKAADARRMYKRCAKQENQAGDVVFGLGVMGF